MITFSLTKITLMAAALIAAAPILGVYAQTGDSMDSMMLTGTVTIGGLFPLTGDASSIGTDTREAALLAVEDFNAYLSQQGAQWQLAMTAEDTATNPVIALEKFQTLSAQGVTAVVGPFGSAQVQNIKGYSDTNDLLVMSYGSTSPALAIPGDSIYRMVPDDNNQGKVLGKLLEDRGIEAMVPIWRGEIYGDGLARAAAEDFESRGGFVHEGVRYNPDAPEFSLEVSFLADAVQEMVDQYGTDKVAVMMISFDESLQIVQASTQYDILSDVWWLGAESVAEQDHFVSDSISSAFAGQVDFTAVQILISPGSKYSDVNSRLSGLLGAVPNTFSYPAYDAVWVIGKAIMEAGSADAGEIKLVLRDVAAAHDGSVSSNELNDAGDLALANYNIWEIVDDIWDVTGEYSAATDMLSMAAQPILVTADVPLTGTVTIGALLPLTGEVSSIGADMRAAAELAEADFNDYLADQDADWRLEVLIEDTATNPVISLEKFQLLYSRGVEVVVGPFASANVQNIKGYSDTNNLLILSPGSTSPALAIPGDSVYRMVPDDNNQGKVIGNLFDTHGMEAMVPIWRGEIYGDGLQRAAAEDFESRGGFVHEGVRYNPDAPELSLEVSALADAVQEMADQYGADKVGVFMISFDEFLQIVQSASQYDILTQVKWYGAESVAEHEQFVSDSIAAEFAEQVDITTVQILIGPGERYGDVSSKLTEQLGSAPNSFAYPTYDSVWVVAKSIMETGSASASDVNSVLRDVAAAHDGSVSSNELNDAGDLALANYQIWKIVDNAWDVRGKYSAGKDFLSAETGPSGEVEVGVIYPLTGRLSSKGAENLAGTQLGAADFNAFLRSINEDWQMVLSVEDSETDPNAALEKAQTLFSRGIDIVIGPETSGNTGQVKPYADTNDMMLISCCSTAPSLAIAGDSVFRLVPDDSKQGVAVGKLLESQGIQAVVPIWRGDAYGDGLEESSRNNFESRGGTVSEGIRYNPEAIEFSGEVSALADEVQALVDQYGADNVAVFMISFDESVQIVQGSANYPVLSEVRWFGSESLTKGTPLIEDRISRDFTNTVQFTSMQIAENRGSVYDRVQSHILEEYGRDPTTFVYQAYDAAWLVGLSILKTGETDAATVKSVFHDVAANYDGALGATTLNEAGDLAAADYAVWQIVGDGWIETGKYSLLDDAIDVMTQPTDMMMVDDLIMVDGTEFAPDFEISGGDVSAMHTNPQENMLIIEIASTEDGSVEITLPRDLIDSKLADDADDMFFVLVDGEEADFTETDATGDSRTLQIDFRAGSERIEVIGTWAAVPEFGTIAALVLAAAIISIVAISARSRLSIVPRF